MPNLNDIDPSDISNGPIQPSGNINHVNINDIQTEEEKYSTPGQQALTAVEGVGTGFAGPVMTAAEAGLSALGVPGLSPEEQELRAKTNPGIRYGFEAGGFGVGALLGTGEAAALSKLGEGAAAVAKLKGLSPLISTGIKAGAEVAALQTGNEISKVINQDPNQSLGSAAINVGLSGILGSAGGLAVGHVSNLWNSLGNKIKVAQFASDYLDELNSLQKPASVAESAGHVDLTPDKMKTVFDPFKRESVQVAASEAAPKNTPPGTVFDPFLKKVVSSGEEVAPDIAEEAGPKRMTPGRKAAQWVYENGADKLAKAAGETASSTIGGGVGFLVGHPVAGAYLGEKLLTPAFTALAKPFAEMAVNSGAMKSAVDYAAQVVRGQYQLNNATKAFFQSAEVVPQSLLPTEKGRDRLKESLAQMQDPKNAVNAGGDIGHYLPSHAAAVGTMAATANNYFNALKPTQAQINPLDVKQPINSYKEQQYNRALDIAQQPLLALQHAKNGTLQSQDVQTLNTLYPGLRAKMSDKLSEHMINHINSGKAIPYHERQSLSMLIGSPLDSTMTPMAAQSIMHSNMPPQASQPGQPKPKKASGTELTQINKVNQLYQTNSERREMSKRN